ncbi:MAG: DNA segregation ATPase FtsK/SpoIIIE, S-DNA-T family [Parcubacteria group bacterium Gr01-1014_18]|nr:MAG: DNA segregation ATPase FtsK/SpoIIIE, S-DNA-T family [Parcubacteria group bacterium Greene0416_36]TSC79694.1 MAG: DNA segregation ATPase FtsK/SpoIIIE, S-DNA-T family [Parcubacteria group bacterium Gr01-1014_18]TSC97858.1 MAG: DNA segregation ATPase FtsK/SpoIIIE, S-DNA-T family [Parcubacteria group bacterium Greene1014_20]TSD06482.1 MAG: DNA segregation ATPase FtsK/SpoIIIE, S-DNA-T family [Parcubacteria group bacterium Greene0714_2]
MELDLDDESGFTTLARETWLGIMGVIFLALSLVFVLSFIGFTGQFGSFFVEILGSAFGYLMYLLPVLAAAVGVALIRSRYDHQRYTFYIGALLLLVSLCGLAHMMEGVENAFVAVWKGEGGGYLGMAVSYPLRGFMGEAGAWVVLISLFLISWMIMVNKGLIELWKGSWMGKWWEARRAALEAEALEAAKVIPGLENLPEEEEEEMKEKNVPAAVEKSEQEEEQVGGKEETVEPPVELSVDAKPTLEEPKIPYKKPIPDLPLDLLTPGFGKPTSRNIKLNAEVIAKTLTNFGIPVALGEVSVGPSVTQFTVKPQEGIKLTKIKALGDDLALALAAHPIRIEAPIPGKSYVGIEVPNQTCAVVKLRDILDSALFKDKKRKLIVALGRDVAGKEWSADIEKMPHLLVAGSTGSGKSVCLNGIIVSLLYQNGPDNLRFIMVDPKRVELSVYNDIPHLLTPVITDVKKTVNALKWLIGEMDRRYQVLAAVGKRNIGSFNETAPEKMPYIVVVFDELADLMVVAAREIETYIIRLAQMARAVGIHLILATQRPSVDVITGLIKANIPGRIAFSVASLVDSRTILDMSGAEKLLGKGDMLFHPPQLQKPVRIQGAFVDDEEIKRVVGFLKEYGGGAEFVPSIVEAQKDHGALNDDDEGGDDDSMFEEAKAVVIEAKKASTSFLQRKLRVGYSRAARLMDLLEERGVIGPSDGARPREILASPGEDWKDTELRSMGIERPESRPPSIPSSGVKDDKLE